VLLCVTVFVDEQLQQPQHNNSNITTNPRGAGLFSTLAVSFNKTNKHSRLT
jgi:hypothetical protein